MKDVMLDLETFGNTSNSVIVEVGMCYFDRYTGALGETFSVSVDPESCVEVGFTMDASTVLWWIGQDKEAQKRILTVDKFSIQAALMLTVAFLDGAECIWSHATFDFVILMNYFRRLKVDGMPSFRSARDLRTLCDLAEIDPHDFSREGVHHSALDDCIFQVGYAVACFNKIVR